MTESPRVLFLGVDAGNSDLIRAWADEGVLPTFRALMARGIVGDVAGVDGFFVGSTWPSFYTGVSPARHGFHSLLQLRPGSYDLARSVPAAAVAREPFWNPLSRAGRRVAVCDVPLSSPAPGLNGMQTVEWGSHDAVHGFRASSPALAREIRARFGSHPVPSTCDADHRSAADVVDFTRRLVQGVRAKAALTRHYLRQQAWDFFAQVFTESHCVGHQCWHLHDPRSPAWDPATVAITGDPLRQVYVAIDGALADILGDVGGDTHAIVLVSHGMSYRRGAQFLLRDVLVRLNAAAPSVPAPPRGRRARVFDAALTGGAARLPEVVRRPMRRVRDRVEQWLRPARSRPTLPPEVADGLCFVVDNGLAVGGIRFNLVGREPRGRLAPGQAQDSFYRTLARQLSEVVEAESGAPMIASVSRTIDLYRGEHEHRLPDVLVEWSDAKILGSTTVGSGRGATVRLASPGIGVLEGVNRYCRSGDHRRDGLFITVGRTLAPGRMPRRVSIMDFAPTFAALLGVALPETDGRAIPELLIGRTVPPKGA